MKRLSTLFFLFFIFTPFAKETTLLQMAKGNYLKASRGAKSAGKNEEERQEILLKARALYHAEKYSDAIKVYKQVLKASDSLEPSFSKAQFGLGQSYAKLNRFEEAEAYYSAALSIVSSSAMKEKIATEFLNEANQIFEKESEITIASAVSLYNMAMQIVGKGDLYEEILFTKAKAQLHKKDTTSAIENLSILIDSFPKSAFYWKAIYENIHTLRYNNSWANYIHTTVYNYAPSDSMKAEALWARAKLYKMPNPTNTENLYRGIETLETLIREFPDFDKIDDARYYIATSALSDNIQRPTLADSLLPTYLSHGRSSERKIEVLYLQAKSLRAQGRFTEAIQAYEKFIEKNPFHAKTDAAHSGIEGIWWNYGEAAFNKAEWKEAIKHFETYLQKYPDKANSPLAYYQKAQAHLHLSDTNKALANIDTISIEYPQSKWHSKGQVQKAKILLQRDPSSEKAYTLLKKFATHDNGNIIRNYWGSTALIVEPTSPFTSNEKISLRCKIQGVDSLMLEIYPIDEEQYFRDKLFMDSLSTIAIELCKPQVCYVHIPAFPKSKSAVEEILELPIKEAGIYLVRIKGDNLETVTTVTVSDIRSIMKQSPKGTLLYVENRRTGKKVSGATVLLTDNSGVTHEGVTNSEGLLYIDGQKTKSSDSTYGAFIRSGAHVSWIKSKQYKSKSNNTENSNVRIFTDKSKYTPNDTVIITVIPFPNEAGTLLIEDSNGLTIAAATVPASSDLFTLKIPSHRHRVETYTVTLRSKSNSLQTASYRVSENSFVQKESDYSFSLSIKDTIIYRDDTIRGSVILNSSKGSIVADLPVELYTRRGETTLRTDKEGVAHFALPYDSYNCYTESVKLTAKIDELKLKDTITLSYVQNEFRLSLQSRQNNREGTPLKLSIKATSPIHEKRTAQTTLKLFKQEDDYETVIMNTQQTILIDTTTELNLKKLRAGKYRAEIHSVDKAGNRIFDEHFFVVVPKKDLNTIGLEITLQDTVLTPDEKLQATVKTGLQSGAILCTFETDSLLSYSLVPIKKGVQKIALPLTATMVPNVTFTATAFDTQNRVHKFTKELQISKELSLEMDTIEMPTAGDSLRITLHVKDVKKLSQSAKLSVYIHEDQSGINSPDDYYSSLYQKRNHEMADLFFDTLSTKRRYGERVEGISTENRENKTGFFAFEEIRKELTKAAKNEYGGIGFGSGTGSGFGGGAGGMGLSGLSDKDYLKKSRIISDSLRRLRPSKLKKKLQFKEYWIATSIKEYSNLKTDEKGSVTLSFHIPDSIKNGIRITAIAMNEAGYIGSFQSQIALHNAPRTTKEETEIKRSVDQIPLYSFYTNREEGATAFNDVSSFINALPMHSYYKKHPVYATQLLVGGVADTALLRSALLESTAGNKPYILATKANRNRRNNLTTMRLLSRTTNAPDWMNLAGFKDRQIPLLLQSIKDQKDVWFMPLCQMEQIALIAPAEVPLIRLQRADREQAKLSAQSLAALTKVWIALQRNDKVTALLPQVRKNLEEHLATQNLKSDLVLTSVEALLSVEKSTPLIEQAMKRVVEELLPGALNNPNQLASIMLLLTDYYGGRTQTFAIKEGSIKSKVSKSVEARRTFFSIPQKYLGTYLSPQTALIEDENDSLWAIDSLKQNEYMVVKVTVKAPDNDEEYILKEKLPSGCSYVSGYGTVFYDDNEREVTLVGYDSKEFRYILKVESEGLKEFTPFYTAHNESQRVGVVDTVTVVSSNSTLGNTDSPYTLYEKGKLAYDRELYARALPLLEKGKSRNNDTVSILELLLYCAINTEDAEKIVSYFEEAKEHNPLLMIPFDKISPIQKAYKAMKLYESGYLLARGTTDSRFIEEMNIIGKLEAIPPKSGREVEKKRVWKNNRSENKKVNTLSSMATMRRVTAAYPHGPLHARSLYLFSHLLYERIDNTKYMEREQKDSLLQQIEDLLYHYLAEYRSPQDQDNAQFTIAAAALDEGKSDKAIRWSFLHKGDKATAMSSTVQVIKAYALFQENRYSEAQKICREIRTRKNEEKHNRDLATYILAQTYHSLGAMEKALPLYEEVATVFTDANQVFASSLSREIEIPEIVSLSQGENRLPLTVTNIDSLQIKTFPIDLLRFLERNQNSDGKSTINLSGISPLYSKTEILPKRPGVKQGDSFETGIRTNGAYITFVQTKDTLLYTIIIKGDLSVSTNKTVSSTIYVSVDDTKGKPVEDATILIKDSELIIKGVSDKRGVFQTASSTPIPTVIARKGDSYGVYMRKKEPRIINFNETSRLKQRSYSSPREFFDEIQQQNKVSDKAFFNQDVQGIMLNQL